MTEVGGIFDELPASLQATHVAMKGIDHQVGFIAGTGLATIDGDIVHRNAIDPKAVFIFKLNYPIAGRLGETRMVPTVKIGCCGKIRVFVEPRPAGVGNNPNAILKFAGDSIDVLHGHHVVRGIGKIRFRYIRALHPAIAIQFSLDPRADIYKHDRSDQVFWCQQFQGPVIAVLDLHGLGIVLEMHRRVDMGTMMLANGKPAERKMSLIGFKVGRPLINHLGSEGGNRNAVFIGFRQIGFPYFAGFRREGAKRMG
ncbi:MAG: hypothetical protein VCF08_12700 [Alphaproteobacteria bacterium]